MAYDTLQHLTTLTEAPASDDAKKFGALTSFVLTYRLSPKHARQIEYKARVSGGEIVSLFLRTKDNVELPGVQGAMGQDDCQRYGFTSLADVVAFLERLSVTKMKRQARRPRDLPMYD